VSIAAGDALIALASVELPLREAGAAETADL